MESKRLTYARDADGRPYVVGGEVRWRDGPEPLSVTVRIQQRQIDALQKELAEVKAAIAQLMDLI